MIARRDQLRLSPGACQLQLLSAFGIRATSPHGDLLDLLALGGLAALGGGSVDVVVRDPALVVGLAGGRDGDGLGAGESTVVFDLLGLLGSLGRALSGRQQSLNPGLVDKVQGTNEGGGEEEVEEDAGPS